MTDGNAETYRPYINCLRRITGPIALVVFLGACAETQLVLHSAKRVQRSAPAKALGNYKVGKPYQIAGVWYYPKENFGYDETGIASWYGPNFHGKNTANGEVYDMNALTAAHRTLPMPSLVQVTNLQNGRSLRLKVNDRGPFAHGRIIDISRRGAQLLGFQRQGTARVRVQILSAESRLLARQLQSSQVASLNFPVTPGADTTSPAVGSSTLAPPPGGNKAKQTASSGKVVVRPAGERVLDQPKLPDGVVSKGQAKATEIFVQAGAFSEYANANRVASRLFGLRNIKISSVIVNGKELFRVRAGPIADVSTADHLLARVIATGYPNARLIVD